MAENQIINIVPVWLAAAVPFGRVTKIHPVDEKGDILVEVELTPLSCMKWYLPTEQGEDLTLIAKHCYGIERGSMSDDELRQACGNKIDGFVYHDEPCPKKAPKYPNECPCGVAAVRCEYHKDL